MRRAGSPAQFLLGVTLGRVLPTDNQTGGYVMENYMPEWRNKDDIADAIRRARLKVVDTDELRRAAAECRCRAAVLRDEAQRLRAESLRHRIRG